MYGSKWTWVLCHGIEIDLILEWGWKLIWFQGWGRSELGFSVGDRNCLGFSVGIEIDFVSLRGVEIDLFLCTGRKWLGFSVWIEISLVFVWELTWFSCRHRNWLSWRVFYIALARGANSTINTRQNPFKNRSSSYLYYFKMTVYDNDIQNRRGWKGGCQRA